MSSFLFVTDVDIGRLNDAQLKQLMTQLGRAALMRERLAVTGLWAGGHQNAPDGGSDVRVAWVDGPERLDIAPRRRSDFQCKAMSMAARAITSEMRPHGTARALLVELAAEGGAYVVVSTETCSAMMLEDRIAAMRAAVSDVENSECLSLDFLDAGRLAQFANAYPGVALWVKETIGEGFVGWRSWGAWSAPGRPGNLAYISDMKARATIAPSREPVSAEEAIRRLREHLANPGAVARIVGLSGLGKTRLAEALFDPSVGNNALGPDIAVYGDVATSPSVSAIEAIDRISRSGERAIVIADNCPHDTHRRMADLISGQASLLTIDFDIDDDQPDRTLIVQLDATADELIDTLLQNRAPMLGTVDRRKIVEFSGGNTRIALALANSALDGESLAHFAEAELLDRLFLNARRQNEPQLARCAEAASLVYSFNITEEEGPLAEAEIIAAWAGITTDDVHRQIVELVDRGLAQVRGAWRAILPHALAAKLARRGFARVRHNALLASLLNKPRLFASLCKRLGLLHDIPEAAALAAQLFATGARLGDPVVLSSSDLEAFIELAPAAPDAALEALERSLRGSNGREVLERRHAEFWRFARVIRSLAYEEIHFARAATLLALMTAHERENENNNSTRDSLEELFHIHLSGTLAPPAARLAALDGFLSASDGDTRRVGFVALNAMLEAGHFSSSAEFTFGARHRTFGWEPAQSADFVAWYGGAIERVVGFVETRDPLSREALRKLAWSISWLGRAGMLDLVESAAGRIRAVQFWAEGWRQIRQILALEREGMAESVRHRLEALELMLRPVTLNDRFTAYVGSENWIEYDPDDQDEQDRFERPAEIAQEIGAEIGADVVSFEHYAPLASVVQRGQVRSFGAGLFRSAPDKDERWERLKAIFLDAPEATRNPDVLLGYVYEATRTNAERSNDWIDALEAQPEFAGLVVVLTTIGGVDARGLARLRRTVRTLPAASFRFLMNGRVVENCPPNELLALLGELYERGPEGQDAAIDVLAMRFFGEGREHAPALVSFARQILTDLPAMASSDTMRDHHMGTLAEACLREGDAGLASAICQRVHAMAGDRHADRHSWEGVLQVVIRHHPRTVLEELLDKDPPRQTSRLESWLTAYQRGDDRSREAPIDLIPADVFLNWVREAPVRRAQIAAELGSATNDAGEGRREWTDLAAGLLALPEGAPEAARALVNHFWPMHLSNLPALIRRRALIAELAAHPNPSVRAVAPELSALIEGWISEGENRTRREDESFE